MRSRAPIVVPILVPVPTVPEFRILKPRLRIRSIFGRVRIQHIRILSTGSGSYRHSPRINSSIKIFLHTNQISSDISMLRKFSGSASDQKRSGSGRIHNPDENNHCENETYRTFSFKEHPTASPILLKARILTFSRVRPRIKYVGCVMLLHRIKSAFVKRRPLILIRIYHFPDPGSSVFRKVGKLRTYHVLRTRIPVINISSKNWQELSRIQDQHIPDPYQEDVKC